MSSPVSQFVLKVHSRCDLACNHCYVYEHADQSWRGRPRAISAETAEIAAGRIAEHAGAHGLPEVSVVLHGGEPLLLGQDRMRQVLSTLTSRIAAVARIDLRVHSNGVRLSGQWCELFGEYNVKVGISLDGDRMANDRHRLFGDGRSSHAQALAALSLLRCRDYRHLYAGILCTIDLANDPEAVYEALIEQEPPVLDLLLPHATWEHPPYRPGGQESPYADWLLRVYRRWSRDGRRIPIRLFDSMLSVVYGGPSFTEAIGAHPAGPLVIETDGWWEQPDSMKTAYDGAPATGLHVRAHSVDEVTRLPAIRARRRGVEALCATCRDCRVVKVCGGGLYAHRYRRGTGFDNPSAYCADLKALIGQVISEEGAMRSGRRRVHALPAGAFDALAAGPGDVDAMTALARMWLSMTRAAVAAVASGRHEWQAADLRRAAMNGWNILRRLDARCPDATAEIFSHPYTHAWAIRCLSPPEGADADLDRAHLAGLAAAAAIRAGETMDLALPVRDGHVHLPTVGALAVSSRSGPGRTIPVSISAGHLVAADGHTWYGIRQLDGQVFRVTVEDLDPFRDCQEWPATARLTTREWLAWQEGLDEAGRRLKRAVPAYARVIGAGLRTVVPLRPGAGVLRSSTARQALGAVAAALPPGSRGLDTLLLHEFQHVKLNALLDLHALFHPAYAGRLKVPWRDDPRPVEGALHGTYAYLALAHLRGSEGAQGHAEYMKYRTWVRDTAQALTDTGALTSEGTRFVAGMARAVEGAAG